MAIFAGDTSEVYCPPAGVMEMYSYDGVNEIRRKVCGQHRVCNAINQGDITGSGQEITDCNLQTALDQLPPVKPFNTSAPLPAMLATPVVAQSVNTSSVAPVVMPQMTTPVGPVNGRITPVPTVVPGRAPIENAGVTAPLPAIAQSDVALSQADQSSNDLLCQLGNFVNENTWLVAGGLLALWFFKGGRK